MTAALDTTHAALAAVLAAPDLATAKAVAQAGLDRLAMPRRFLPLKAAAHELALSDKTLRRRARAGAGVLTAKGWIVDLNAAAAMGRKAS